jgi:hypothetical protein
MHVNNRVLILREAITKIVPMLTQRSVKVTQQGTQAYVSYDKRTLAIKKVNLPYIPDDADDILLDATQGFLDHEVGHILFTDQKCVLKAEKQGVHTLHNMIEDTFVERRMGEQFPGCGSNLSKMHGFFLTEYIDTRLKEAPEHSAAILLVCALRAWAGQPAFVDYMKDKWAVMKDISDRLGKDFPSKLRGVKSSQDGLALALEAKQRLEPKKPPMPKAPPPPAPPAPPPEPTPPSAPEEGDPAPASGEEEPGDTAAESSSAPEERDEEMMPSDLPELGGDGAPPEPEGEEVREPEPEPTGDEAPPEDPEEGDDEPGAAPEPEPTVEPPDEEEEPALPSGGGSSGAEPEDDEEAEDEEGERDAGMSGGGAGEDTESDSGENPGDENSDSDTGASGGSEPASTGEGEAPGGGEPQEGSEEPETGSSPEDGRDIFKEISSAPVKDFDEAAADALTKSAVASTKESDYSVFTRDEDQIGVLDTPEGFDQSQVTDMQNEVDHMVGPMQKDIQRAIAARSASVWTGGHKRGKLHGASLSRVLTGREDVFRQKQVNTTKDVAVSLLVDASGSMSHARKIIIAGYTAYALSSVLDNLSIPNEVLAFSTTSFSSSVLRAMQQESSEHGFRYDRSEALNIAIIKSFAERITPDVRRRFALLSSYENGLMQENVDGESVQIANRRLQQQRASRKVLMVLSDGKPACGGLSRALNSHLKEVVKQIEARGTDVVALGIVDKSVREFYKRALVIDKVADLPTIVMKELHKLLVQ